MSTSQPTRSVPVGRYALAVGAPAGSVISPGPLIAADVPAEAELVEAIAQPTAGEKLEGAVVSAQEATKHLEQAESLLRDVLAGNPLDPADLPERVGVMLKVLGRFDEDGRYKEWLRYARAMNGLFALAMRWAKLVSSLRATLRAAEGVPKLERAVGWAEHELGTLHLAAGDTAGAEDRLERAREIRDRIGDADGLAATEQSLGVLCRQKALEAQTPRDRRSVRRLLAALAAALLLLLLGGVAGAMIDPFATANGLSVRVDGPGTVTTAPAGIRCPDTCDAQFAADASVLLTASAGPGATFAGWGGDCEGKRRCRVKIDADRSVTARFVKAAQARTVSVRLAGDGTGEVTSAAGIDCPGACRTSVARGTLVRLVPTPLGDSTFAGWSGVGCDGTDPCTLTVDGPVRVVARFAAAPPGDVPLTVTPMGDGSGTVTSDREGISCPKDCVRTFPRGTEVTLTQVADQGSDFAGWSGEGCSGVETCTVTLSEPREVTATFALEKAVDFLLTTSSNITATTGSDDVGDDCSGGCRYPEGTDVTLTTAPPAGTSTAWDGCEASATDPDTCTVRMDQDRTVSATFQSTITEAPNASLESVQRPTA
jgi:Divergent InlB B-repeat domain